MLSELLAAANPVDHLTQLDRLFVGLELPDGMWQDFPEGAGISKPVIYLIISCAVLCAIFIPMARNFQLVPRRKGNGITGVLQALFEPLLLFVRNDIVRDKIKAPHKHDHHDHHAGADHAYEPPAGGEADVAALDPTGAAAAHPGHSAAAQVDKHGADGKTRDERFADQFLPFHWTLFFFILVCNLVGLTPEAITVTGQLTVTLLLSVAAGIAIIGSGIYYNGVLGYWYNLVPHDIPPFFLGIVPNPIWILVFTVEFVGLFFKPFALAIRLFANMTGGHLVIGVLLGFAVNMHLFNVFSSDAPDTNLAIGLPVALLGLGSAVAIYMLEVIICLVQAYVFTLLTATFIGMSVNQDH